MKNTLKLLSVLALMLTSFSQSSAAAGSNVYHRRGEGAVVEFESWEQLGCIRTSVYIEANEALLRNPSNEAERFSGVSVFITKYDYCPGSAFPLLSASGGAELPETAFQVSGAVESAVLDTTVTLFDEVSATYFDVDLHLSWTGSKFYIRRTGRDFVDFPGCKYQSRFDGFVRFSETSGTVSSATINFTPADATLLQSRIFSDKNGTVDISCNL